MGLDKELHWVNPRSLEELLDHKDCIPDSECSIISGRELAFSTAERIIELEKALGLKRT